MMRAPLLALAALAAAAGCSFDPLDRVHPPDVMGLSAEPALITVGSTALITVSAVDPDGHGLTFEWEADGGELVDASGPGVQWHAPTTPGAYRVDVRALNNVGLYDEGRLFVAVVPAQAIDPNDLNDPVATISATPTALEINGDVAETAIVSVVASDADGDPLTYEWLMGVGTGAASGPQTDWTPTPGACCTNPYPVGVIVSDGRGRSATATMSINIVVN